MINGFYIRRIRNSFPFLFLAKPTPPFYSKLILIKISIRCEQGTAKFVTQACHLSSFASSRKTFNIYILRAQLGRLYPVENNKIMKGIEKERSYQASEAPVGIRHLRGVDVENEFQVKLLEGI